MYDTLKNMEKISELSVFFPMVNEEENLRTTVEKAIGVLENVADTYEILVIDDGSKDHTAAIAKQMSAENPKIRVITHATNQGYGAALRSGFYNAQYRYIVYTDGDGQFDFSEVTKLLEAIKNADAVWGYRIKRMDPLMRILNAKGWKLLIWSLFGVSLKDVDCGFKMIRKEVLDKIPKLTATRGGTINAELFIKLHRAGFKIAQVGVNHYPRKAGSPTGAAPKVIITSIIGLLQLWWEVHFAKKTA